MAVILIEFEIVGADKASCNGSHNSGVQLVIVMKTVIALKYRAFRAGIYSVLVYFAPCIKAGVKTLRHCDNRIDGNVVWKYFGKLLKKAVTVERIVDTKGCSLMFCMNACVGSSGSVNLRCNT